MDSETLGRRLTAVGGVVFVVLWLIAVLGSNLGFLDDGPDIAQKFTDDSGLLTMMGWLGLLSVLGLLWFIAGIATGMQRGGEPRLATAGAAGGVVGASATGVGFGAMMIGGLRADDDGGLGSEYAAAVQDISMISIGAAGPIGFAALAIAVGAGVLRTERMSAWFGWVSIVLGIALLIPFIAFFVMFVFLVWVLYLCYVIVSGDESTPAEAAPSGAG